MSMHRVRFLTLALALMGVPPMADAQELRQERLFALLPATPDYRVNVRKFVEIDTRASHLGEVLREWPANVEPPLAGDGGISAVGAGRYLVWVSGHLPIFPRLIPVRLHVFDTVSGTVRSFDNVIDGPIIAVDSKTDRVFFAEPVDPGILRQIAVLDVRTGAIRRFPGPEMSEPPGAYAVQADRLFVRRRFESNVVDVIDVAGGAVVQTISVGTRSVIWGFATDPGGTRLFTLETDYTSFPYPLYVSAYDTATNQLVARTLLLRGDNQSEPFFSNVRFDPDHRRVLLGSLVVFDADTLTRLGSLQTPCGDARCSFRMPAFTLVGPRSPLLFFTSNCVSAPLQSRDPNSGQLLATADLAALFPAREWCVFPMTLATVPAAPRAVTSDVQGHRVTVSWADPGNTTHFQIEAGSSPGLANLYQQAVGGTSVSIENVPAGTYYVRVRAVNYVGRSVPVEIAVVVH
jgi:hypothetical protein